MSKRMAGRITTVVVLGTIAVIAFWRFSLLDLLDSKRAQVWPVSKQSATTLSVMAEDKTRDKLNNVATAYKAGKLPAGVAAREAQQVTAVLAADQNAFKHGVQNCPSNAHDEDGDGFSMELDGCQSNIDIQLVHKNTELLDGVYEFSLQSKSKSGWDNLTELPDIRGPKHKNSIEVFKALGGNGRYEIRGRAIFAYAGHGDRLYGHKVQ